MWALAVVNTGAEFAVRDRLLLNTFLPYTQEKVVKRITPPRTISTPRPRVRHVATLTKIARWPGYLFAEVRSNEDLSTLVKTRDVLTLVKNGEGEPALLGQGVMTEMRKGCLPCGLVTKAWRFEVGDLLRFVARSSFAGQSAEVLNIDDNGNVRVLVNGALKATVHHSELGAIG